MIQRKLGLLYAIFLTQINKPDLKSVNYGSLVTDSFVIANVSNSHFTPPRDGNCHDSDLSSSNHFTIETFTETFTWIHNNQLMLNVKKTKCMLIGSSAKVKNKTLDFYVDEEKVDQVTEFKYLGLLIDSSLRWNRRC